MSDARRIYDFFVGVGTDHAGRTISDYHTMDNTSLELIHDYIQWAFPTREASQCQAANAPLLSDEAVELLQNSQPALDNYYTMLYRMIGFYEQTKHWLVDSDHNHLRITRIIESSAEVLGLGSPQYFLDIILELNKGAGSPINEKSIDFWLRTMDAVKVLSTIQSPRRPKCV